MGKGSGKGKGKGGCDCIEDGCQALEAMLCCVLLMLVLGPVLLITGAAMLGSSFGNSRGRAIQQVKDSIKFWGSDPVNGIQAFQNRRVQVNISYAGACNKTTSPPSLSLQASTQKDEFIDEANSLQYAPLKYKGVLSLPAPALADCLVDVQWFMDDKLVGTARSNLTQPANVAIVSGSCPQTLQRDRDVQACQQLCRSRGGELQITGQQHTCRVTLYATKLCIRVSQANEVWSENIAVPGSGPGCFYPQVLRRFTTTHLSSSSQERAQFEISLRSAYDPYLKYLVVTDGTLRFGLTRAQRVFTGIGIMAVGALVTTCWFAVCFFCCKYACGSSRPTQRPPGVGGFAYDVFNKYGGRWGNSSPPPPSTPYGGAPVPYAQPAYPTQHAPMHYPAQNATYTQAYGQPVQGHPHPYAQPYPMGPEGYPANYMQNQSYPQPQAYPVPQPPPTSIQFGQAAYGQHPPPGYPQNRS